MRRNRHLKVPANQCLPRCFALRWICHPSTQSHEISKFSNQTPCSTFCLEKLTMRSASQEIPQISLKAEVYTVVIKVLQRSLPWGIWIKFTVANLIFLRYILILSFHLCWGLPRYFFSWGFSAKVSCTCLISFMCYMTSQRIILDLIIRKIFGARHYDRSWKLKNFKVPFSAEILCTF